MRIAIVNPVVRGISRGYQKYLEHLLPRLVRERRVEKLLIVSPELAELAELKIKLQAERRVEWHDCLHLPVFNYKRDRILKRFQPDIVFVPIARRFSLRSVALVTMIHNMEPLAFSPGGDNPRPERVSHCLRRFVIKRATDSADRLIAISGFVKEFLVKKWQIPPEKIARIYFGVDAPNGASSGIRPSVSRPSAVGEELAGKFIFTAGSIRPARGLEDVIRAMGRLSDERSLLVIAGGVDRYMRSYYRRLRDLVKESGLQRRVIWCGALSEEELQWCYANSGVFVMTSRVEACPNIALEAMARGCLCIAADNPPLPEIFQDAAFFYPSGRDEVLAQRIETAERKQEMRQKARARAKEFDWNSCVDETVNQLEIAANEFKEKQKRNR